MRDVWRNRASRGKQSTLAQYCRLGEADLLVGPIHHAAPPIAGAFKPSLPLYPIRDTVHFGNQNIEPLTDEQGSVSVYTPLIRLIAKVFTQPRFAVKVAPQMFRDYLEPELVKHFGEIDTLEFKSVDGMKLKGYWMPQPQGSEKTVVMGHGYKANWRALLAIAEKIRDMGYNVFLFDFRGHGDSDGLKTSFGYHEGKDVAAAINLVKEKYGEDANKLVYYGHSMGAAAVMLSPRALQKDHIEQLEQMTNAVDGIIVDAPYAYIDVGEVKEIKTVLESQSKGLFPRMLRCIARKVVEGLKVQATDYLNLDIPFTDIRPAKHMKDHALAQKPLLQFHGTEDETTPFSHALSIHRVLRQRNPNAKLVILDNTNHTDESWDPFNNGRQYTTALRGGDVFLDEIERFLKATTA